MAGNNEGGKRMRWSLSMKRNPPVVVHQNVQLIPPVPTPAWATSVPNSTWTTASVPAPAWVPAPAPAPAPTWSPAPVQAPAPAPAWAPAPAQAPDPTWSPAPVQAPATTWPPAAVQAPALAQAPAPGYDEEGRLPESLPPTPIIDLITEDEASEFERTPRRAFMSPIIGRPRPQGPGGELDHRAIEADAAEATFTSPPPLMRLRCGKNLAMLRSIAEAVPAPQSASPESPESPEPQAEVRASPTPSVMSEAGPAPNVINLLDEERRRLQLIEEERRRLDEGKRRLQDMAPRIRRRRDRNEHEIQALERHIAMLQKSLENRVTRRLQLDFELESIDNFCGQ